MLLSSMGYLPYLSCVRDFSGWVGWRHEWQLNICFFVRVHPKKREGNKHCQEFGSRYGKPDSGHSPNSGQKGEKRKQQGKGAQEGDQAGKMPFSISHHTDRREDIDSGEEEAETIDSHSGYGKGEYGACRRGKAGNS